MPGELPCSIFMSMHSVFTSKVYIDIIQYYLQIFFNRFFIEQTSQLCGQLVFARAYIRETDINCDTKNAIFRSGLLSMYFFHERLCVFI